MKILIATDAFPPQISGVVTTLIALEKELKIKNHDVRFIQPNMFFNIPTPGYKEIPMSFPLNIEKNIQEFQPDAIHIHTEGVIGLITSKVCRKLKLPYTTGYATHFAEMIKKKYKIPQKVTWWYLRRHHNAASRTLVATDAMVEELRNYGINNADTIGKGVDIQLFNSSYRNEFPMQLQKPVWLYVGRISIEKNLEDFLKLDLPGTKVCVGRGPEFKKYKNKYSDTMFVGHKTGILLAQWYATADVFVFPSKWDTFGLVMIEAGACGTPSAAYSVRGPLQAVKHGVSGYLDNDLKIACEEAIKLNRTNVEEFVHATFSWETVANNFISKLEPIFWREKINWSEYK